MSEELEFHGCDLPRKALNALCYKWVYLDNIQIWKLRKLYPRLYYVKMKADWYGENLIEERNMERAALRLRAPVVISMFRARNNFVPEPILRAA